IEKGFFQQEISEAAYRYQREIDTHQRTIVGVNDFVDDKPVTIPLLEMDPAGYARQVKRLEQLRRERDSRRVGHALDRRGAAPPCRVGWTACARTRRWAKSLT